MNTTGAKKILAEHSMLLQCSAMKFRCRSSDLDSEKQKNNDRVSHAVLFWGRKTQVYSKDTKIQLCCHNEGETTSPSKNRRAPIHKHTAK